MQEPLLFLEETGPVFPIERPRAGCRPTEGGSWSCSLSSSLAHPRDTLIQTIHRALVMASIAQPLRRTVASLVSASFARTEATSLCESCDLVRVEKEGLKFLRRF